LYPGNLNYSKTKRKTTSFFSKFKENNKEDSDDANDNDDDDDDDEIKNNFNDSTYKSLAQILKLSKRTQKLDLLYSL